MLRNSVDRYGSLSITLHWLMLLLIAAVYACIELRVNFPRGSDPREALKAWHFTLGLSVLLLVCVRFAVYLRGPTPLIKPNEQLAETIEEVHKTAGTVGYWLIGLHAAAALYHHYVRRDNTFTRMWPPLRGPA